MLGLPTSTQLNQPLPKTAIYSKFQMTAAERAKIDADISRIVIVHEVSAARLHLDPGEKAQSFFVLQVSLKRREFSEKTIITLSRLIPQNMVLLLEYAGQAKLAVYYTRLLQTPWCDPHSLVLSIKGLTMDAVWENVIAQIGGIQIEAGHTLEDEADELPYQRGDLNGGDDSRRDRAHAHELVHAPHLLVLLVEAIEHLGLLGNELELGRGDARLELHGLPLVRRDPQQVVQRKCRGLQLGQLVWNG